MQRLFRFSVSLCAMLIALTCGVTPPQVNAAAPDDFVITVKTDNAGTSSATQFTIPTLGGGYNYNVDCNNNGTNEAIAQTGSYTCNYGAAGTYTIRIKDNSGAKTGFPWIYFNNGGDKLKLLTIAQWGTGKWTSMQDAFNGCANLTMTATDAPDLSGVMFMNSMFADAAKFNGNIGSWNTSNVVNMRALFWNAAAFNQNIGSWNTSNVTDMSYMFRGAETFNQNIGNWVTSNVQYMTGVFASDPVFNQNIGGWNTSQVTDMSSMFAGAAAFNQDISGWNTGKVTDMSSMFIGATHFNQNIGGWNTALVTRMDYMFYDAAAFNQNIGGWNTGKVTTMSQMFHNAAAFNQNLASWNTIKVTTMSNMFNNAPSFNQNLGSWKVNALLDASDMFTGVTLTTANYDALLNGWDAQTLKSGVVFSGGSSKYCAGETARSHILAADGWSITDGGKSCATATPTATPTSTATPTAPASVTPTPTATGAAVPSTDLRMVKKVKKLSATGHRYKLKVTNLGANAASSVTITDTLPKHYTIAKATGKTAACQKVKRTVTCTLAQLNPGATAVVSIVATSNGAQGKNCAFAAMTNPDTNSANNKGCVKVP